MVNTMRHLDGLLPDANRKAAEHLFALEVGLRELIIEILTAEAGAAWYTTSLPSDVQQKYHRGRQMERTAKWSRHIDHHPLYYIDFPDLSKVLDKNWKSAFKVLFHDKDVFLSNLKSLEPIRNKLAHNRKLSDEDCAITGNVLALFETAIGRDRLRKLVHRCSVAPSIPDKMRELSDEIVALSTSMASLEPAPATNHWSHIRDAWWFNSEFLAGRNHASKLDAAESKIAELKKALEQAERERNNIQAASLHAQSTSQLEDVLKPILTFFELCNDYHNQPRTRGTGHKLEHWRSEHDINEATQSALTALDRINKGAPNE